MPGIYWDAPDGQPVRLVFLLLTPEREHGLQLQILAAIAQAMMDREAREHLAASDTSQSLLQTLGDALRAQDLVQLRLDPPAPE